MRYDTVVFDLDGTLVETGKGIAESVQYAVAQMDHSPVEEKMLSRFVGPPLFDAFQEFLDMDDATAETAVTMFRAHYETTGVLNSAVYCGIPNLLRLLKDEGVYLAVATTKPAKIAKRVLGDLGLLQFFDRIAAASPAKHGTDKSELIAEALPAFSRRAAMIGDRCYDMEAAVRNHIDAIGAGWGYAEEGELAASGAGCVASSVEELGDILCEKGHLPVSGYFITIEGLDGSGKTTQINALREYLTTLGYDVRVTREPGGTPLAEEIRAMILDPDKTIDPTTEAYLYAAARAEHVRGVIRPALRAGQVVLCDRYLDSSIAYQGGGRELGGDVIAALNTVATDGVVPDLTLLFTMDPQAAFLRRNNATDLDRLERSGEAFFRRVCDAYAALAAADPGRIRPINASLSIEEVKAASCAEVYKLVTKI